MARRRGRKTHRVLPAAAPPGQTGGQYKPLTDADVIRIHHAALDVLETIGIGQVPPVVVELAEKAGCHLNSDGRLCYPRGFVEDVIAGAARNFVLHGRDPQHDFEIKGTDVRYGTGGAAVRTLDIHNHHYRPSTLADLYDFARLADTLENVNWFTRCVVATDVTDPYALDINTAYATAAGTTKHIGTSFFVGDNVAPVIQMFDWMLGHDGAFKQRPFCKVHISPIVSPLRYGEDAVDVTLAAIKHGMPINAIIAAQSGATAPATLAGMLVQSVAETLAGLLLVNLFSPGYPVIFSNWPFVIDLRTGAFSGSGGEISLLNAAAAQLTNYYDLPSGVAASMTDSKVPDVQAGYEKALSTLTAGLAGANLVYESSGMYASLLGASFEGFVIDNEMLGHVHRVIRGIEVTDDTLALSVIEETVKGDGHFLGHDHTIASMIRDYHYPQLGDRQTPDSWEASGSQDMWQRSQDKAKAILSQHYPHYIDEAVDQRIREHFNILLPRETMRPHK